MNAKKWILPAALIAAFAASPITHASVLLHTNFNNADLAANGLYNGSYEVNPSFAAAKGIAGNTALDFGTTYSGAIFTPYMPNVAPILNFSLDALYQGPTGSNFPPGALAVTWSNIPNGTSTGYLDAGQKINATTDYSGAGYPMHSLVGLGLNGPNTASLAATNGQGALLTLTGNGVWYGGASTTLLTGHWYQFSGTIWYDPDAAAFNFVNVALNDLGASGTDDPATALGADGRVRTSFAPYFPQSDGVTESGGRLGFMFSGGAGFQYVNNINADTGDPAMTPRYNTLSGSWSMTSVPVPEPASLTLLLTAGILLSLRRRPARV